MGALAAEARSRVYVDDLMAFIQLSRLCEEATMILIFLEIIGAPINYKKVFIGLHNVLVGFYIDTKLHHYAGRVAGVEPLHRILANKRRSDCVVN